MRVTPPISTATKPQQQRRGTSSIITAVSPSASSDASPPCWWRPSNSATAKLFVTGATVGPLVDSLHNQVLLEYHTLPIVVEWPGFVRDTTAILPLSWTIDKQDFLLCSSWTVPPLLGVAYVVLGGILPRLVQKLIRSSSSSSGSRNSKTSRKRDTNSSKMNSSRTKGDTSISRLDHNGDDTVNRSDKLLLRNRALLAVVTTALIILASDFLESHPDTARTTMELLGLTDDDSMRMMGQTSSISAVNIAILSVAALLQWALLDGTLAALVVASLASVGGPLAELPFVAYHVWEYLPTAADYVPLANMASTATTSTSLDGVLRVFLGDQYQQLALSSITGPCYFAVTMDSIALGRWFDSQDPSSNKF